MTVPVVGTALIFSLMIGPPAAARAFTNRPPVAIALSVAIALIVVWAAIALSYETNWPVGFFVGTGSAAAYATGRAWRFARRNRHGLRRRRQWSITGASTLDKVRSPNFPCTVRENGGPTSSLGANRGLMAV